MDVLLSNQSRKQLIRREKPEFTSDLLPSNEARMNLFNVALVRGHSFTNIAEVIEPVLSLALDDHHSAS